MNKQPTTAAATAAQVREKKEGKLFRFKQFLCLLCSLGSTSTRDTFDNTNYTINEKYQITKYIPFPRISSTKLISKVKNSLNKK